MDKRKLNWINDLHQLTKDCFDKHQFVRNSPDVKIGDNVIWGCEMINGEIINMIALKPSNIGKYHVIFHRSDKLPYLLRKDKYGINEVQDFCERRNIKLGNKPKN